LSRRRLAVGLYLAGGLAAACSSVSKIGGGGGAGASVLERGNHPSRDAHFVQPALTRAAAATMALDAGFHAAFTGAMYASPLYFEKGPGGRGLFFAATTGNDVFALDETTGAVVWTKNLGPSPTANGVDCGNIHPLGIVGTPIIDAAARTIYVAGAIGTAMIDRHEVHALSVDDGSERPGWPIDVSKVTATLGSGSAGTALPFMPPPQNQRGALSLVSGVLYVPYGGHGGDCGPYHGWVVAIDTKNPSKVGTWATGGLGEGIWASGGMASDGDGVFAVTGNSTVGTATHLDSEEVVRITGMGTLDRSSDKNLYYPAAWHDMDAGDLDFGSSSPVYLEVPGATPSTLVAALSKNGHLYLLDSKNLGGMNGHVVDLAFGNGIFTAPAVYTTERGVHLTFYAGASSLCPGGQAGEVIISMLIPAAAPPTPSVAWCTDVAGRFSPIVTTTDGKSEAIIWFASGGNTLMAVDGETGLLLYTSTESCPAMRQYASPIAVKGRIVVSADNGLCSWSPRVPASDGGAGG
jgi:outer membrane protein assembly factor BamB